MVTRLVLPKRIVDDLLHWGHDGLGKECCVWVAVVGRG